MNPEQFPLVTRVPLKHKASGCLVSLESRSFLPAATKISVYTWEDKSKKWFPLHCSQLTLLKHNSLLLLAEQDSYSHCCSKEELSRFLASLSVKSPSKYMSHKLHRLPPPMTKILRYTPSVLEVINITSYKFSTNILNHPVRHKEPENS